jgi:hypothetical protein
MDKIKELLIALKISEEAADELVAKMVEWKETEQNALQEELQTRLQEAKKVCIQAVAEEKQELARKVEIFLESKVAAVERGARGRLAIEESEAANSLKQIKQMLEGINVGVQNEDLQATQAENEKLRKQLATTSEERNTFQNQYKRAHGIAEQSLARTRNLEEKLQQLTNGEPIEESNKGSKRKGTILEESRKKSGKPKTNRPTRKESQQPAKKPNGSVLSESADDGILSIAAEIEEVQI